MKERDLFLAALEINDPAARRTHLYAACAGDAALLARVEALLDSHDGQSQFLKTPAVQQMAAVSDPGLDATIALGDDSTREEVVDPTIVYPPEPAGMTPQRNDAEDENHLGYLDPSSKSESLGRLAHYEVLEVIGRGAFGTVLRAFDEKLHRVVAIKVMAPELASTSPARRRFLREAQASAAVRHEHVVGIHAVEEKPLPYIVMDYIPGQTLQKRLDERGPLDVQTVLMLGRQIAEGLAAAHSINLIHRDIKPSNILLETSVLDRIKITDFGLARAADDASLTQSGMIAGTPMYMAPEQALGKKLDQRADLFSFGSVLYQMVSGRPPFRAPSALAVLKRVADEPPRPIQEIIPETPDWLCGIIAKLHAKEPEDRFQSAREVADLLADCEAKLKAKQDVTSILPVAKPTLPKWVAAAVLLLPILALALTETAGVTHLLRVGAPDNGPVTQKSALATLTETTPPASLTPAATEATQQNPLVAKDEWIDVIPLIDPKQDKWNNPQTGANDWRVEGNELIAGSADAKPCKLILPLDSAWQAFECEVEFTRRSGSGTFNFNIPTSRGDCPLLQSEYGIYLGRRGGGVVLNDKIGLKSGVRTRLRTEVRRERDQDHVSVWINDAVAGSWQGERERISAVFNEGYPIARRVSLYIHPGGNEFVFHSIRLRMLEGGTADLLRASVISRSPSSSSPTAPQKTTAPAIEKNPAVVSASSETGPHDAWIKATALLPLKEQAAALTARLKTRQPGFEEALLKIVPGMAPDRQAHVVATLLRDRNSGFDGEVTHKIEGGVVTSLEVPSPLVLDLTPLQTLAGLKAFTGRDTLGYDNQAASDRDFLRSLESLETINGKPAAQFWKEAETRQAEFQQWLELVPTLTAEQQAAAVASKLKERNPGLDGTAKHTIEGGAITQYTFTPVKGQDRVTDLSPVQALTSLKGLNLWGCSGLVDLGPLKGLPLTRLIVGSFQTKTQIRNLEPLRGMKLTELNLYHCQVSNFEPLRGMPLTLLSLFSPQLQDCEALRGMKLTRLSLDRSPAITDFTPIEGMPLTGLALGRCQFKDIGLLKGMPLTWLMLADTKVQELEVLNGMPLKTLQIHRTGVTNLNPLAGMELEEIRLTPKTITLGLDTLRDMKSLKTIGVDDSKAWPAAEFWERYDKGEFTK
ncbi:MAG TPA: protein kinase [Caulifigura sp.]|nr:protein kinase [Caulifigura sp.]